MRRRDDGSNAYAALLLALAAVFMIVMSASALIAEGRAL